MKREEKELLLRDLCGRLPYGVKIHIGKTQRIEEFGDINLRIGAINNTYADIRPYLFPLSSMTEEQKQYLKNRFCYDWDGEPYELWKYQIEIGDADELIDWFNKNHFDYRGLIKKGLAKDATDLNIY
jgi:hypothetical protein